MANKKYDYLFKVLLVGDRDVGKTRILLRFADDTFYSSFISNIGIDFKIATVQINGKDIKLQLWDTTGQERFRTITTAYYRGTKGIMLVYDVTNSRSFSNIEQWLKNIKENVAEDVEIMILGNSCDQEVSRVVSKEQGEELAMRHDVRFMEVSDKANINIKEAFLTLAKDILEKVEKSEITEKPIPVASTTNASKSGLFGGIFGRHGSATSKDRQAPPQTVLSQKLTPADSCLPDTSSKLQTKSAPEYNKQPTVQQLENKPENTDGAYQALSVKCQELSNTCQDLQANSLELNVKYQALDSKCRELENERNEFAVQCQKHADKLTYLENDVIPQLLERLETLEMSMSAVERLWVISRGDVHLSSKILGTGGWGVVQEATYKGQKVAAKTIHEEIISDHNQGLFLKEIKMMAKCYHKNLVEFIGAVPDKPAIIVIELMHSTLRSALRKGTISPHQIQPACLDVAQGLRYLHNMRPKPIIHRDVSTANVLLKTTEGGGWISKLSDFGSAQFAHLAQTPGPGAAVYAAPEVTGPPRQQTVKIDVYSYGVLLVEVLTKNIPTGNIIVQLQSLEAQWPQYVAISRRCVNRDPNQRPTMTTVLVDLDKIVV